MRPNPQETSFFVQWFNVVYDVKAMLESSFIFALKHLAISQCKPL